MSLVAYGSSSDEESSDEVEEFQNFGSLPAPSNRIQEGDDNDQEEEEDDEFLRKKAQPAEVPPSPATFSNSKRGGPVRISIPSLRDFKDLEEDHRAPRSVAPINRPGCGLLTILPKPKGDQTFQRSVAAGTGTKTTTLVPHSVSKKKAAAKSIVQKPQAAAASTGSLISSGYKSSEDSDGDEDTGADFFSLADRGHTLPEVSKNEINLMVAKRAAQMAQAKHDQLVGKEEEPHQAVEHSQMDRSTSHLDRKETRTIDDCALQSLVGSRAKRARLEDLEVIELSHEQVMPSRDEWMRNAVASSTTAPIRGELKDGPKGVARKKHQITYLAHQAKSNQAELQAIWAANRQTQRQSQSKYGW